MLPSSSSGRMNSFSIIDHFNSEEQLELVKHIINTKLNYDQKKHLRYLLNPFTQLAELDVIYEVFSFLDFKELVKLRFCNRKFNQFITSDFYWSKLFCRYFAYPQIPMCDSMFERFIEELKRSLRFKLESLGGIYMWNGSWTFPIISPVKIVTFQAKAQNDIHIALSSIAQLTTTPNPNMYEIVLGGWNNNQSVIRSESQGQSLVSLAHNPCDANQFLDFWVCIDSSRGISCGAGTKVGEQEFMCYSGDYLNVDCVGFSTWDKSIEYKNVKTNSIMPTEHDFFIQFTNPIWLPLTTTSEAFLFTMKQSWRNLSIQFSTASLPIRNDSIIISLPFFPKLEKRRLEIGSTIRYYVIYCGKRVEIYVGEDDEESIPVLYETRLIPNGYNHFGFNGEHIKFIRISEQEVRNKVNPMENDFKFKKD